jgi:hypothetical protein
LKTFVPAMTSPLKNGELSSGARLEDLATEEKVEKMFSRYRAPLLSEDLKALLAAPLEGVHLEPPRDVGRKFDL